MKKTIVAASGYFDPIHVGHIEYLEKAKALGDELIVILNTDKQAIMKKGFVFMPEKEREQILKALRCVDKVVLSIDDDQTQCKTLELLKPNIFAKGGDRYAHEIPESKTCDKCKIKIIDGLGSKIQSSSDLVKKTKDLTKQNNL